MVFWKNLKEWFLNSLEKIKNKIGEFLRLYDNFEKTDLIVLIKMLKYFSKLIFWEQKKRDRLFGWTNF